MTKVVLIFGFLLLTFSLTKCVKQKTGEPKTVQVNTAEVETQGDQDHMKEETVDLINIMNECNDSFRIEMSFIEALNDSGSFPDETDRTPKCFLRCVLESTRVASNDGVYDVSQAGTVLSQMRPGKETEIQEAATNCIDRRESCKCERAYQFMKCLLQIEVEKGEKSG